MFKRIHPYVKIILTFISVILIGTLCLALPYASQSGKSIGFVDALFTATSATCVTGLSVVTIATDFTIFGKIFTTIHTIFIFIKSMKFNYRQNNQNK